MQKTKINHLSDLQPLLSLLSQKEVQNSLIQTLEKLPELVDQYSGLERNIAFIKSVINDKESMEYLLGGFEDEFQKYIPSKDSLEALITLVHNLPKYTKLLTVVEPIMDFLLSISRDKESVDYLYKGAKGIVGPIQQKVENGWDLILRAKIEADKDHSPVTIFTVFKLIKEPAVQQSIHFIKALLTIASEPKSK
ncbi:hypothetical protein QNH26_11010 [Peribacillus frigoritolerans]|uniref:hypothetical protein n=1 Tax=Peribacillus frigoritolerans TaxID=450367 RepID=UPI0024C1DFE5|nr:hypothetical protein [Peribacillus frigoritolerans]WHX69056.1 hypothetical protein QNH26_11010 [Peribacillus frigoritolerans]